MGLFTGNKATIGPDKIQIVLLLSSENLPKFMRANLEAPLSLYTARVSL
jgi:hypothetical protein